MQTGQRQSAAGGAGQPGSGDESGDFGQPDGGGESTGFGQPAVTEAERVAMLDRELNEQLAGFDGILLGAGTKKGYPDGVDEEQGGLAGAGDEGPSGGDTAMANASMTPGDSDKGGSLSGGGGMPDIPGDRQGEHEPRAATLPVPPDIPKGDDDDVVARQLREAAMMEKDPVLRRKLWNEYRKYTGLELK